MKALTLTLAGLLAAQVLLTWQDNSNNEDGFRIERRQGTNAFAAIITVGANARSFTDTSVENGRTYDYRVAAFNTAGDSPFSNVATVTVGAAVVVPAGPGATLNAAEIKPGKLVNVSNRAMITATDTTLISGVIVSDAPVRALVRVIGPALGAAPFNVPGVCPDPVFTLHNAAGDVIATNDNWSGAEVAAAITQAGASTLPAGSKDAALVITLAPGNYTVVARGVAGATGVGLAEVFALPTP